MGMLGGHGSLNRQLARPVQLRLLVCDACRRLNQIGLDKSGVGPDYHSVEALMQQMDQLRAPSDPPIHPKDILDICDTEGNAQNGGGTFSIKSDRTGMFIQYMADGASGGFPRVLGGHGEIGSPVTSSAVPFGAPRGFGRPGGGIAAPGF